MKTEYQNNYVLTISMLKEYYNKFSKFRWLSALIFVIFTAVALTVLRLYTNLSFIEAILYAMFIACLFLLPFRNWWGFSDHWARREYKKLLIEKNDDMERNVKFADHITMLIPSLEKQKNVEYSQITKVIVSKNIYILIVQKTSGIILAKGAFTVGEEQAFLSFIKNKCGL